MSLSVSRTELPRLFCKLVDFCSHMTSRLVHSQIANKKRTISRELDRVNESSHYCCFYLNLSLIILGLTVFIVEVSTGGLPLAYRLRLKILVSYLFGRGVSPFSGEFCFRGEW